jgi:hypothetical protein
MEPPDETPLRNSLLPDINLTTTKGARLSLSSLSRG